MVTESGLFEVVSSALPMAYQRPAASRVSVTVDHGNGSFVLARTTVPSMVIFAVDARAGGNPRCWAGCKPANQRIQRRIGVICEEDKTTRLPVRFYSKGARKG